MVGIVLKDITRIFPWHRLSRRLAGTDHMKLACPARFERATYALVSPYLSKLKASY
jgi:hypothetical protein